MVGRGSSRRFKILLLRTKFTTSLKVIVPTFDLLPHLHFSANRRSILQEITILKKVKYKKSYSKIKILIKLVLVEFKRHVLTVTGMDI